MARDIFHNLVKEALQKDGWTITDDPFTVFWGEKRVMIDLAAEKLILAEKNKTKIAVDPDSYREKVLLGYHY